MRVARMTGRSENQCGSVGAQIKNLKKPARLDTAHVRIKRARMATAAAEEANERALEALQAAVAEEQAADEAYNTLATLELTHDEDYTREVLKELFVRLGSEKAKLSPELQRSITEASGELFMKLPDEDVKNVSPVRRALALIALGRWDCDTLTPHSAVQH